MLQIIYRLVEDEPLEPNRSVCALCLEDFYNAMVKDYEIIEVVEL